MKRLLQLLALAVLVCAVAFWFARGANRGWTKTSVPVTTLDNVTGIEGIRYQNRLVPGLDFLGGATLTAGILTAASLIFQKKPTQPTNIP